MNTTARRKHPVIVSVLAVGLGCAAWLGLLHVMGFTASQPEPGDDVRIEGRVTDDDFTVRFEPGVTDPFTVCLNDTYGGIELVYVEGDDWAICKVGQ